ncbi:MAG: hypothetical protein J6A83_08960 [Clostridia bacterium]|nr:hypothetical protein [Clostridia bacterium]
MEKSARKTKAVEFLKKLDIYEPNIEDFVERDYVCLFEGYGGFWAFQYPELMKKVEEIEKRSNGTVYAITHEFTAFGECYSFLIVTDYEEEWEHLVVTDGTTHYAFAYVWNKTDDECSEYGTVGVHSFGGGIRRVA